MPNDAAIWLRYAKDALSHFPVAANRVELISRAENVAFYVETKQAEKFVLRIHRPEYHTLDELVSEQLWTEALLESGFDVPIALRTLDGSRYTQIDVNGEPRNVGLLRWVDGNTLRQQSAEAKNVEALNRNYRAIGRLLAILHEQAANWNPPPAFARHAFDEHGLVGNRPFWGRFWDANGFNDDEKSKMLSMRLEIHALLSKLPKHPSVYSMIHADLHTGNLIAHDDGLHIIDFDDAGYGWHSYDFAVALGEVHGTDHWEAATEALFTAYAKVRKFEPWVRELVPLFHVIRNLVAIGWIDARPELHRDASYARHNYNVATQHYDRAVALAVETIDQMPKSEENSLMN